MAQACCFKNEPPERGYNDTTMKNREYIGNMGWVSHLETILSPVLGADPMVIRVYDFIDYSPLMMNDQTNPT